MAAVRSLLVDCHTHLYLPRYSSLLRSRTSVPFIRSGSAGERLIILEDEPSGGRPVGPQYWDRDHKLAFMDKHEIDISIVSTANPWLDFLTPVEAIKLASELNVDLEEYCSTSPSILSSVSGSSLGLQRLYGLGLLPIVPRVSVTEVLKEIERITSLKHLRGLIMGTQGLGNGLDDDALEPVWEAIAKNGLVVFLHPHYGLSSASQSLYGDKPNGHVLPLALGFPFETTIAITRLILAGTFDRHPDLKILLAHSGGALPQLSSRLASCIIHEGDKEVRKRLKEDVRYYLGKLYFDAVAYGPEELDFVSSTISRSERYSSGGAPSTTPSLGSGSNRMLFGTDNPFFPPIAATSDGKWTSVVENLRAIEEVDSKRWSTSDKEGVKGTNAMRLFGLI